ncbi:hypothetical protein IU474_04975 [Nocardia otitidiscaviarum]|uniref:hypothetical protein n=1 Tax=Nocardia otitidiscaviarum TaxID=1823 RepID=UPI001892E4E6|nr:hypothetical protein [Nocardia otitidiscaviarum]MBF6236432.1 hypothetical protein [Nocardia otitidiscaviarum]
MTAETTSRPAPPHWKQAVVSGLSIFPISLLGNGILGPLLVSTPLIVRTLTFTVLFSTAMTFLAVPATTRLLRGWLYPTERTDEQSTS